MKAIAILALSLFMLAACHENPAASKEAAKPQPQAGNTPTTAPLHYTTGDGTAKSVVAFDSSWQQPHPVVLVLPEWWGLTDYPVARAKQLAGLGYFAVAVDVYGDGRTTEDPKVAGNWAGAYYKNPELPRQRIEDAIHALQHFPQADTSRVAIVGYCFGGSMGLLAAQAHLPLRAVVSMHGELKGTTGKTQVPLLICQGEADQFVGPAEVAAWRKTMDSLGVTYIFRSYHGATHSFTNPTATEIGKRLHLPIAYNAAADTASWNEMKGFLEKYLH